MLLTKEIALVISETKYNDEIRWNENNNPINH